MDGVLPWSVEGWAHPEPSSRTRCRAVVGHFIVSAVEELWQHLRRESCQVTALPAAALVLDDDAHLPVAFEEDPVDFLQAGHSLKADFLHDFVFGDVLGLHVPLVQAPIPEKGQGRRAEEPLDQGESVPEPVQGCGPANDHGNEQHSVGKGGLAAGHRVLGGVGDQDDH